MAQLTSQDVLMVRVVRAADSQVRYDEGGPVVHRLGDVHIRGLLALLADDDRSRLFASRELGVRPATRSEAVPGGDLDDPHLRVSPRVAPLAAELRAEQGS